MTKIYSELFENADPNKALNSYKTNGAFVLKNVFNKIEINKLRNNLDTLFSNDGDQRIRNLKESNTKDLEFYLNYFYNQNLLNFFNQVFNKNNNNKNYLLPPMHFAKNYLPHSKFTRIGGWHRDCGGELNYSECRRLIQNDNYYFGKVGIYCQDNGEYGGGIDVIPKSNNDYIKNSYGLSRGTIGVKTLRIAQLISKSFHKFLSRSKIYHLIFGIEKLNINQGDVVFFDARIWHKGSYAFSNIEKNLEGFLNDPNKIAGYREKLRDIE